MPHLHKRFVMPADAKKRQRQVVRGITFSGRSAKKMPLTLVSGF
jgi:hypothetical protein